MTHAHRQRLRPVRRPVDGGDVLNVALYPFLPRPQQFEYVATVLWKRLYPDVSLVFVDYDCYHDDPPDNLDVFAFDCIYASAFWEQGFVQALLPSEIEQPDDLYPYGLEACAVSYDGDLRYAGVPYLGCVYSLIYRSGDSALDDADSLEAVYDVIGTLPSSSGPAPPPGKGLIVALDGATTDACFYLETWEEIADEYPPDPPLPGPDGLDDAVIENLKTIRDMAGIQGASHHDPKSDRVDWFVDNLGEAMVGPTETMSYFPLSTVETTKLHALPFTVPRTEQPFYVDALGINAKIDPSKLGLALEFVNLVAGTEAMTKSLIPDTPTSNPQYLTPVRRSCLQWLAGEFPAYAQIAAIVDGHDPTPFRIGPTARDWLDSTKSAICAAIFDGEALCETEIPHPALRHYPAHVMRVV